jgi:hypothetical protein
MLPADARPPHNRDVGAQAVTCQQADKKRRPGQDNEFDEWIHRPRWPTAAIEIKAMTAITPRVIIMLHLDTLAFEPLTISPSTKWLTSKEYPVSSKFDRRTACFAGSGLSFSLPPLFDHYADSSWVLCQALRPQPQPPDLRRGTPSRLQIGRLSSLGLSSTSDQAVEIDGLDRSRANGQLHQQLARHRPPNATRAIPIGLRL